MSGLDIVMPEAVQNLGRFQVLTYNQLIAPGKCAGCGGFNAKARYIDFGLELDFYGVVYLCLDVCFTEVANQIGFISPEQALRLKAVADSQRGHIDVLQNKLSALESVRNAMDSYLSVDPDSVVGSGSSVDIHSGGGETGAETEGPVDPGIEAGQSGPVEPVDVDGLTSILDDDSVDKFAKDLGI